jgi:putative flippase GtrA
LHRSRTERPFSLEEHPALSATGKTPDRRGTITAASGPGAGRETAIGQGTSRLLSFVMAKVPSSRRPALLRFLRYSSVSVVSTITSIVVLGILVGAFGFPAVLSNVIATVIATVPSFELNRRWVWKQDEKRSVLRQALPYFLLSLFGLVVSTLAVHLVADMTVHSTRIDKTLAAEMANLAAYGSLWCVQYVLCDRILFRSSARAPEGEHEVNPVAEEPPHLMLVREPALSVEFG